MTTQPAAYDPNVSREWGWSLLLITLPLWAVFPFGVFRPFEIAVLLAIIIAITASNKSGYVRLTFLDCMVYVYALFHILVVSVSSTEFYESARAYRYMVLGPVLVYLAVRMLPFSPKAVSRAHLLMVFVILIQTVIVILAFQEEWIRPRGTPNVFVGTIITYSFFAALAFFFLLFNRPAFINKTVSSLSLVCAATVLAFGLFASATRGVVLPMIVMLFLAYIIWKFDRVRKAFLVSLGAALIGLLLVISISPPAFVADETRALENRGSYERLYHGQDLMMSLSGRVYLWSLMMDKAMQRPIFGHGMSARSVREAMSGESIVRLPAHGHNILISSMLTGGVIGLLLLMTMIIYALILLSRFSARQKQIMNLQKTFLLCFPIFIVILLTNDFAGGRATLFFFLLGMIQQLSLHQDKR